MSTPVTPQKHGLLHNLYVGTGAFDIIGKRKRWYIAFAVIIVICLGSMAIKGFNYGIEFTGGTQIQMPVKGQNGNATVDDVLAVYKQSVGHDAEQAQTVGSGPSETVQLRSVPLDGTQVVKLKEALFAKFKPLGTNGQPNQQSISDSAVSSSWGGEISQQALIALAVFLVLVTIFLAFYFERAMALAALASLANDLIVTAGVYSIIGFEVTPATVIGFLTILGFSLYDTVVVFDKVRENTRGLLKLTRRTYGEAANLAVNQTLMRSINTSLIALLPVLGLLIVGVVLLGVGTLQDLALIQLTGMLVGAVSSIFLATPLVVDLKMRDPKYKQQAERVAHRRANLARKAAEAAAEGGAVQDAVPDGEDFDPSDDEALAAEVRKEKAMAAAASTPSRTPKARPSGKSGRPTGKRRH